MGFHLFISIPKDKSFLKARPFPKESQYNMSQEKEHAENAIDKMSKPFFLLLEDPDALFVRCECVRAISATLMSRPSFQWQCSKEAFRDKSRGSGLMSQLQTCFHYSTCILIFVLLYFCIFVFSVCWKNVIKQGKI